MGQNSGSSLWDPTLIVIVIVLLIVSSLGSSSETALFSLDRFQLRRLKDKHKKAYERIKLLLEHPTRLLIIILIINEFSNLSLSALITDFVEKNLPLFGSWTQNQPSWLVITILSMAIATPLTVLFGEITPKILASKTNRLISIVNSKILILFYRALKPLLIPIDSFISTTLRTRGSLSKTIHRLDEADLVELVEEAHREGTLEPSERKLIKRVFHLDDISCASIMTPLSDAFMLNENQKIVDIIKDIKIQKYSRIPIYSKNKKNIMGILYVKDLLALRNNEEDLSQKNLKSLSVKPIYVSPNTHLSVLMKRFKKLKIHMAVVVGRDEKALGIITMEDVLESIFGEIEDERDI